MAAILLGLKSVAFPAIGVDDVDYQPEMVASEICNGINDLLARTEQVEMKRISIVLDDTHPDIECIEQVSMVWIHTSLIN